jgi:hypothetical protein
MSMLNLFNITPKFRMCTKFVMFTEVGFETMCSTFTGLRYGQKLEYPALKQKTEINGRGDSLR